MVVFGEKLIIGGNFVKVSDQTSAKYIVAYDGAAWTPLPSGASNGLGGEVMSLAVFGGQLYAGGKFTTLGDGTTSAKYIAAWSGSAWASLPSGDLNGVSGNVNVLTASASHLYLAGAFTTLGNGTSASCIAAYDGQVFSNLPAGDLNGFSSGAAINAMAATDSALFVGGQFTALADGTSANYIVSWNFGTSTWSALPNGNGNGFDWKVQSMAIGGGGESLYVGGYFGNVGSTSAKRIAKWDLENSQWSALVADGVAGVDGGVVAMVEHESHLFIAGEFTLAGNTLVGKLAQWNPASSTWSALAEAEPKVNGLSNGVMAIINFQGKQYLGGNFMSTADGVQRLNSVASFDGTSFSGLPCGTSVGFKKDSTVWAFAKSDTHLYIGGTFTALADDTSANYVVSWDGTQFAPLANGFADSVRSLSWFNGKLFCAGYFTTLGDYQTSVKRIAIWDGSAWSSLAVGSSNGFKDGLVFAMHVFMNKLFMGGSFTSLSDDTTVNRIVVYDGTTLSALPGGKGFGGSVKAFAEYQGKLYIGGEFQSLSDSTSAKGIVSYDGTDFAVLPIVTATKTGNGVYSGEVSALAVFGDKLWLGGSFSSLDNYDGNPQDTSSATIAKCLAAWDASSWSTFDFSIDGVSYMGVNGGVNALAVLGEGPDAKLSVGGGITTLGDDTTPVNNFMLIHPTE